MSSRLLDGRAVLNNNWVRLLNGSNPSSSCLQIALDKKRQPKPGLRRGSNERNLSSRLILLVIWATRKAAMSRCSTHLHDAAVSGLRPCANRSVQGELRGVQSARACEFVPEGPHVQPALVHRGKMVMCCNYAINRQQIRNIIECIIQEWIVAS
jgi:hypothetical protein